LHYLDTKLGPYETLRVQNEVEQKHRTTASGHIANYGAQRKRRDHSKFARPDQTGQNDMFHSGSTYLEGRSLHTTSLESRKREAEAPRIHARVHYAAKTKKEASDLLPGQRTNLRPKNKKNTTFFSAQPLLVLHMTLLGPIEFELDDELLILVCAQMPVAFLGGLKYLLSVLWQDLERGWVGEL
jgi:hypothetical protein